MKNKADPNNVHPQNRDYSFTPVITTIAIPMLLFGRRKKAEAAQDKQPKHKQKSNGLAVAKYELSENAVKFFAAKGFPKKQWVLIKEIPLQEITNVESFGNELSLTWNGVVYEFALKKPESFSALRDQIVGILEDQPHETVDNSEVTNPRKSDLTRVINGSIDIVDSSFDILMGLHGKRVNWTRLEKCADRLGNNWSFTGQTLAPLNLDFTGVSAAIKKQVPKETSKEAYNILKLIYEYFNGLKPSDDLKESILNFENAKDAMLAYYTLNDVLFGKVVGDLDNVKESASLESVLLRLADGSNVKVSFGDLKVSVDRLGVGVDGEMVIGDARAIFKEQLKLF
jgi:hypothetical protein